MDPITSGNISIVMHSRLPAENTVLKPELFMCKYQQRTINRNSQCIGVGTMTYDTRRARYFRIRNRMWRRIWHMDPERCDNCGVIAGEYHEFGCQLETCPCCKGQVVGCDCSEDRCLVRPITFTRLMGLRAERCKVACVCTLYVLPVHRQKLRT